MRPIVYHLRELLSESVHQKIKCILDELDQNPRPTYCQRLRLLDINLMDWESRWNRIDSWRIVEAVNESWPEIGVSAIQKRPPYEKEFLP